MTEERKPHVVKALFYVKRFVAGTPRNAHLNPSPTISMPAMALLCGVTFATAAALTVNFASAFAATFVVPSQAPSAASLGLIKFPQIMEPAES